jgi:hypothetical protein
MKWQYNKRQPKGKIEDIREKPKARVTKKLNYDRGTYDLIKEKAKSVVRKPERASQLILRNTLTKKETSKTRSSFEPTRVKQPSGFDPYYKKRKK